MRFDALVVGAGPAGSLAAFHLARGGARVLLADKARFPRDKPCGGGITVRAERQLPFSIDSVVEDAVDVFDLRLGYGRHFRRRTREPLIRMTQRRRLDASWSSRRGRRERSFATASSRTTRSTRRW